MITWNQKDILLKETLRCIKKYRIKSLFDIGAGNGKSAETLSKHVKLYTAVERNAENVKKLKSLGLKTIKGQFPLVKVSGKFNMVLSSHSIPENDRSITPFIKKAMSLLKQNGIILFATFKGGRGDLSKLTEKIEGVEYVHDKKLFEGLISCLLKVGKVKIKKVKSALEADNLMEITEAVSLSFSANKRKKYKRAIQEFLQKNYRKESRKYRFRFEHVFIVSFPKMKRGVRE